MPMFMLMLMFMASIIMVDDGDDAWRDDAPRLPYPAPEQR